MIASRWLWAVALGISTQAAAQPISVLVEGAELTRSTVPTRFLLPDGAVLSYQDVVLACSRLQAAGVLHFYADDATCRPARLLPPERLPDVVDLAEGVQIFDERTRESCKPGRCKVVATGADPASGGGPPPVSINSFVANPAALTGSGVATLSWDTFFASSCTLSDDRGGTDPVAISGSVARTVDATTLFTLDCINAVSSDSAAVTVTVSVGPEADAGTATTAEDASITVTLTGSGENGDPLNFAIDTDPNHGSLGTPENVSDTSAEVRYDPDPDFNGTDSFTFTVSDGATQSAPATIQIEIQPVNDPPAFTDGGGVVGLEDTAVSTDWALDISPGPADEAAQAVSFIVTGNSNPGLFAAGPNIDQSGILTFSPTPNALGSASLEVVAQDDGGGDNRSAPASFTIEVIAAADLAIDKTSGSFFTPTGGDVSYTIVISNAGPSDVAQATVIDMPPPRLGDVTWTCTPTGAANCQPLGSAFIDTGVDLPEGSSVTFRLDATLLDDGNAPLTNVAEVQQPAGVIELAPADNVDSDTDLVALFADGLENSEPD